MNQHATIEQLLEAVFSVAHAATVATKRYPLDRRLGGPQSRSGLYGEEKNLAPARK
jgi:hypothetical protein